MLSDILGVLWGTLYVLITYTYFMLPVIKMGSFMEIFNPKNRKRLQE